MVNDAHLKEAAIQFVFATVEDARAKFANPLIIFSTKEDRQFVYTGLARFGYKQFSEGLVEPDPAGHWDLSLVYQLPALLYRVKSNCDTLGLSPVASPTQDWGLHCGQDCDRYAAHPHHRKRYG